MATRFSKQKPGDKPIKAEGIYYDLNAVGYPMYALLKGENGKRTWRRLRSLTITEAKAERQSMIEAIEAERKNPQAKRRAFTFREYADKYLKDKAMQVRRIDRVNLSVKSLVDYFGDVPLGEITKTMILEYREKRRRAARKRGDESKPLTAATVNRELAQLRNMLMEAYENELLESPPRFKGVMLKEDNVRDRVLSADEETRLLESLPAYMIAPTVCAIETGMRRGEIFGLTWDRVNLAERKILVTETKSGYKRSVPISDRLADVLGGLPRALKTSRVFTSKGDAVGEFKTAWTSAKAKAGIADLKFHDLRHTFITRQRRKGIDHLVIMDMVGHKSLEMLKRYNSVSDEDRLAAVGVKNAPPPVIQSNTNG